MRKALPCMMLVALLASVPASAEPNGVWWSGWGMGTAEYGINDKDRKDELYIACPSDRGARVWLTVGGENPEPNSIAIARIGREEFQLIVDDEGSVTTNSHVAADNFEAWWSAMRGGSSMTITLSTGKATTFTLQGSAKTLPRTPCKTGFAHF